MDDSCPQTVWQEEIDPMTNWQFAGCLGIINAGTALASVIMDDATVLMDDATAKMDNT